MKTLQKIVTNAENSTIMSNFLLVLCIGIVLGPQIYLRVVANKYGFFEMIDMVLNSDLTQSFFR